MTIVRATKWLCAIVVAALLLAVLGIRSAAVVIAREVCIRS